MKTELFPVTFVSLGPGEAELITVKGLKALQAAEYIFCPETPKHPQSGKDDKQTMSRAATILQQLDIAATTIQRFSLPMSLQREKALAAYDALCAEVSALYQEHKRVCIVAEGDAGFYSSIHYVFERLQANGIPVNHIPGIPAFIAAGALGGLHVARGEERLTVIPGVTTAEELERLVEEENTVVIMKLSRCTDEVHRCICRHPEYKYHYFENVGLAQERYSDHLPTLLSLDFPYFSLLMVSKK